jgi:hypothetical protein
MYCICMGLIRMTKTNIKKGLDFLPLIILSISAGILIWTVATSETMVVWKHIAGLSLLPVNSFFFYRQHKTGVLISGLILFLGLFNCLSFSPVIHTLAIFKDIGDYKIPLFYGQPIFFLWLTIHLVVSGRYYVGITTKKYWKALMKNEAVDFG